MARALGGFGVVPFALCLAACTRTPQVGGSASDVARARGQLGLTQPLTHRRRVAWTGPSVDFEGHPSPNGRLVSTTTGAPATRSAGSVQTPRASNGQKRGTSSISPSRQAISRWKDRCVRWLQPTMRFELRAMPVAGPDWKGAHAFLCARSGVRVAAVLHARRTKCRGRHRPRRSDDADCSLPAEWPSADDSQDVRLANAGRYCDFSGWAMARVRFSGRPERPGSRRLCRRARRKP